jgi:hypothetical protein
MLGTLPNRGVGAASQVFEDVGRNDEAHMIVFVSHGIASFFMNRDIVIAIR